MGFITGLFLNDKDYRRYVLYLSSSILFYLWVISTAATKLFWYTALIYPFLSLLIAVFVYRVYLKLQRLPLTLQLRILLAYGFLLGVLIFPYSKIIAKTYTPTEEVWDLKLYPISSLLQETSSKPVSLSGHNICYHGYSTQLLFYVKLLNQQGQNIAFKALENIQPGDTIIAAEPEVKAVIEGKHNFQVLRQYKNVLIYRINNN